MSLNGQQNVNDLPIDIRQKLKGAGGTSASGNVAESEAPIIFDKIIQCGAELTSTNYILITLKSEQEQGSEDANYELLNYIYDNFEEHTSFFKRIKLRFLEASFDFPKYNNIESNWARLALKSYVKENDVWKIDAGKDVLEYHLCFDIRDFQLDKYDEQKAGSDQIIFDGKMFFYLSKNRMFMLDLYYRDVSVVLGNTRKRAFISSDIVNSGKLVLYGEQKDEVVDNVPTSAIELDYMLPALLFHIKNDAKMNINFNIKLTKKTGTQDKTKLIVSYSSGSIQNPGTKFQGIEITGLIDGEFKDILFEAKDLLKCQFIKENPNKLQVFTNYNMQPFIDEMKDEVTTINNKITIIEGDIITINDKVDNIIIPSVGGNNYYYLGIASTTAVIPLDVRYISPLLPVQIMTGKSCEIDIDIMLSTKILGFNISNVLLSIENMPSNPGIMNSTIATIIQTEQNALNMPLPLGNTAFLNIPSSINHYYIPIYTTKFKVMMQYLGSPQLLALNILGGKLFDNQIPITNDCYFKLQFTPVAPIGSGIQMSMSINVRLEP